MQEITQAEITIKQAMNETLALFIYTPLCGTCKLGQRMLNVIEQTIDGLTLYQTNINFAPTLVNAWQITSVPCLIVIERGRIIHQLYALKSIDTLYEILKGIS